MPTTTNHDFNVSDSVNREFERRLSETISEMNLVRVSNTWPTAWHPESEVTYCDYNQDGGSVPCLTAETFECHECGERQHHDHGVTFPPAGGVRFCGDDCVEAYAAGGNYVRVSYGHGSQWYEIGNTAGELAIYSSVNSHGFNVSPEHPFLIGFEVEKVDYEWHELHGETDVLSPCLKRNWIAVSDGSLCHDHGFEMVSPAYNLTDDSVAFGRREMNETLSGFSMLNADSDSSCGGHVTVSCDGLDGPELAQRIEPLFPVLFALYPNRVGNEYSQAVRGENATNTGRKFRAINTLHNRVEFRLFSAVETGGQLMKRAAVLRETLVLIKGDNGLLGVQESRDEITAALNNEDSPLSVAISKLVGHGVSERADESRAKRIEDFKQWYATGESNETTRRYLC